MSIPEEQEILLSQLVDHELPAEQANQVLGNLLDELGDVLYKSEACQKLHTMLQLQKALGSWRRQTPPTQAVVVSTAQPAIANTHSTRRFLSLATAALVGGLLVAGGFYLGGNRGEGNLVAGTPQMPKPSAVESPPVIVVTPEQQREIARAFALHESVAGPLSWYAADDTTIQIAPADKKVTMRQPVAVVLRLTPTASSKNGEVKTYVIVCRDNDPATITLPRALFANDVRLQLISKATDKGVNLQYAVVAEESDSGWNDATLVGRRQIDVGQTSLGQLAMNDRLVNVDASAWVMKDK